MKAKELIRRYNAGERDFRGANLRNAHLGCADLRGADLMGADLRGANLSWAELNGAKLEGADLMGANLSWAKLNGADLEGANLRGADLNEANLQDAYLVDASLRYADLQAADLYRANLREADLGCAKLSGANLSGVNLSGTKDLLDAVAWLRDNFESDADGLIVYKGIGDTNYLAPDCWTIEPGAALEEVCDSCRTSDCACGVSFATMSWVRQEYRHKDVVIWRCRIEWMDLAGVVVPYNTNGKARCARLTLLEKI
jgi:hypothetical protein